MKQPLFTIIAIGVIGLSQRTALCEYEIDGIASFGQANPSFAPMRFNITLEARDNDYRITAKAIDGVWYNDEITSGDGTNNYFLDETWPSWEARRRNQGYAEAGTVISGDFPANSLSIVQLTWLAYIAGSYLHSGTNSMKLGLRCANYAPDDRLTQVVKFADNSTNCIDEVRCFAPGGSLISSSNKQIRSNQADESSYLLWKLQATSFTNVGRFKTPAAFEYSQYFPSSVHGTKLDRIIRATWKVTRISDKVEAHSLLPVAKANNVRVFDWRFNKAHFPMNASGSMGTPVVTYRMKHSQWKTGDDPTLKAQMFAIQRMVHERQPSKASPTAKRLTLVALLLLTTVFGWFITGEMRKNKNKNKNVRTI